MQWGAELQLQLPVARTSLERRHQRPEAFSEVTHTGNLTSPWELKTAGGVSNDKSAFGLFGSTKTTKPASLFGAATSSSGVFSSTAPVFPSGSVFGDSNQSASRPAPTFGGSLFNGLSATPSQKPSLGFGSGSTATLFPSGSVFGDLNQSASRPVPTFGGSLFSSLNSTGTG